MAKKSKKKVSQKKKSTNRRPSRKSGKASAKIKSKSVAKGSRASGSRAGNHSVDLLLKKFAKDRAQQETQLSGLRKQRADVEAKTSKLQEQIGKLVQKEKEAESKISGLDRQRDLEVKQLLSKLGIKIDVAAETSPSPARPGADRTKNLVESRDTASSGNGRTN